MEYNFKEIEEVKINDIIQNNEFINFKNQLNEFILKNFSCRNENIIVSLNDEDRYQITKGNLLTMTIMLIPFDDCKDIVTSDYLFDYSNVHIYNQYFDILIDKYKIDESLNIKKSISKIISELSTLSGFVNLLYGNTISIKSFIDLAKRNKEFNDLLHFKLPIDKALEFDEIDNILKNNLKRLIEILKEEPNCLRNFLLSGAGINEKQLGQVMTLIGPKPNLEGKIIPIPINTSFLRGLNAVEFYINATGARKALYWVL